MFAVLSPVHLPFQVELIRVVEAGPPLSALPAGGALTVAQVEGLVEELATYHSRFSPLYVRQEQREWSLKYLQGLPVACGASQGDRADCGDGRGG